jgi:hypothetical protein
MRKVTARKPNGGLQFISGVSAVNPLVAFFDFHESKGESYGPFSLCVIWQEGLCPSSGDINRLMMKLN